MVIASFSDHLYFGPAAMEADGAENSSDGKVLLGEQAQVSKGILLRCHGQFLNSDLEIGRSCDIVCFRDL